MTLKASEILIPVNTRNASKALSRVSLFVVLADFTDLIKFAISTNVMPKSPKLVGLVRREQ